MSQKNIIQIAVALLALLIVGFVVYSLIPRATLLMSVAPEEFTVTINGHDKKVKTGDEISVTPGDVKFTISRDGFDSYTHTVSIKNGQKVEILQALKPQTDEARKLLETEKSQAIIQRVTNVNLEKASNNILKDYPLVAQLPINDKFYSVRICESQLHPNDATKVAVCVLLYNPEAKQSAIDDVTSRGFDLNDYETYFQSPDDEESTHEPEQD
jgi:hypothetical protein